MAEWCAAEEEWCAALASVLARNESGCRRKWRSTQNCSWCTKAVVEKCSSLSARSSSSNASGLSRGIPGMRITRASSRSTLCSEPLSANFCALSRMCVPTSSWLRPAAPASSGSTNAIGSGAWPSIVRAPLHARMRPLITSGANCSGSSTTTTSGRSGVEFTEAG